MKPDSKTVSIQMEGLPFIVGTFPEVINTICRRILKKESQIILPCSLNDFASISASHQLSNSYEKVDICTTDGMPVVWLAAKKTRQKVERVYGPDMMRAIYKKFDGKRITHVLYGSTPETLTALEKNLRSIAPHCTIAASISPPMRKLHVQEEKAYIRALKKIAPDIIWIGISSPAQIELAARWKHVLPNTTFMCVGAAFDFVAETKVSAPKWMKCVGLEWFFRLMSEPKRLWRRYLITIPRFLYLRGFQLLFNP